MLRRLPNLAHSVTTLAGLPAAMLVRLACVVMLALVLAIPISQGAQGQELAQVSPAPAPGEEQLVVGVYVNEPFVEKRGDGTYTGMAIELWEYLARSLGLSYRYQEFQSVRDMLVATVASRIDVAVTNLTITEQRARRMDFTQPWFDGGNRIMVATNQQHGFSNLLEGLHNAGFLRAYAWIAGVILLATVLLTIFDRHFDQSFPRRWRDGIAESFYTVMLVATSGKPPARKNLFGWIGRIGQGLWLVCGVAVVAYVTSSVTSVMTTLSLTNRITSVEDLDDHLVGVMSGSAQEEYARREGLRVRGFRNFENAVNALIAGEVDAIIHDAPVLEYYAYTHHDMPIEVVGRLFERQKYGFALPLGSDLTRPLTLAILLAVDEDEVDELRAKYFGSEE